MKDYYTILGLSKNATSEEIKRAYRKLAHQHHPDKKGGDEKKFKEINEAYQILGNETKRKQYDQFGQTFHSTGQGFGGFSGFQGNEGAWENMDFGDIFEEFFTGFGTSSQRQRRSRGSDIATSIDISFSEAVFGSKRTLVLEKSTRCARCMGTGAEPGSSLATCAACQGRGTIREMRKSILGSFATTRECAKCNGRGEVPQKQCSHCKGSGIVNKKETTELEIPAGIRDGEAMKLPGQGEAISNGETGDLYIKIHVLSHPVFRREGNDLAMTLTLPMTTLLLGNTERIETLDGPIELKVPELSREGDILRVRGKGVARHTSALRHSISGTMRGDLLVHLKQKLPRKLSSKAKKSLEDLQREGF